MFHPYRARDLRRDQFPASAGDENERVFKTKKSAGLFE